MRFESIRVRGLGPFRREVSLDLTAIDGQLVALCGVNGAGKSTLLELFAGALYRRTATRGSLGDLATARDAFVEVRAVNGRALTVRQTVDAHTGKGEALVTDESGAPLLDSAKVREWDRWAAEHIVPESVLYSGPFARQRSYGFLDLARTERVGVLLRALGIERYEAMAKGAAEGAKDAKARADELRRAVAGVPAVNVAYARERLAEVERRAQAAEDATKAARLAFQRAQAAAADYVRARELVELRQAAERRLDAATAKVADLEARLAKNRELLGRAVEVRKAVARAAELRDEVRAAELQRDAAEAEVSRAAQAVRSAERALDAQRKVVADAHRRVEACERRLADRERVLAAVAQAAELRTALETSEKDVERHAAEVERLTQLTLAGKDQRIDGLRRGLTAVVAHGAVAPSAPAIAALSNDDALAAELAGAPARLDEERKGHEFARRVVAKLREDLRAAEQLAARAPEMESAAADLEAARDARDEADLALACLKTESDTAKLAQGAAERTWVDVRYAVPTLQAKLDALASTVDLARHLDQAEGRIEAYEAELPGARAAVAAAEAELAGLPDVSSPEAVDIGALERQVERAEESERSERAAVVRCAGAVEAAEQAQTKRAELEAELRAAETELADWTRLAQDLGRDGLQALEIDAAIPELNTIANDLLHSCHGTRFTVELRTDRLTADGKRTVEDLEARVIDSQEGRDAEASTYSPGELVIVSEAIALAITTRSCRQSGIERPTLIRDETGAALSQENGRAYIRMLRRAAQLIGADKVLYVSHSTELQELADVRVEISADHQITVGGVA